MSNSLTSRERFNRVMRFQTVDRLPILSCAPWQTTVERWLSEGMQDLENEFAAFDGPMQSCWLYGKYQGPIPAFEEITLAETGDYRDTQNYLGQKERWLKSATSMPFFLEYPVKSRPDWESYKQRLNPHSPGRYPENWAELLLERNTTAAGEIRGVAVWGFYGFLREMMGPEALSLMYYDDPGLIRDMNEFWAHYTVGRLERAVREMAFDYALIWEDNCYNHGMLHSPRVFREFMEPGYKLLVSFFRKHGIDLITVDSDGNVSELIPLLLEVGVTGMHPFEVAAGMDVIAVGKQYPGLQMWGGIDKRALARNKQSIDAELMRVIPAMKRRGGYAACLDHNIPSDVPLENHRYYVKKLLELSVI